jgi:1-acyl-sn-glycerol-3-phosphate acyltransferase
MRSRTRLVEVSILSPIPQLWDRDPERIWHALRWGTTPALKFLAPGSTGYGLDRVPLEGGGVVAANHFAAIDHPLIGIYCPRTIFYMAKVELMGIPVVGELLSWTGAFAVRRGEGDRDALREARRAAREGHFVGVHVEGTRQRFGYPGEVKIGGVMIAMQEGVPIIPCAVETFRWGLDNARPCAVVWGEPISLEGLRRNKTGYAEAVEVVGSEIIRLWRLAAEAVARGMPHELSDGARRFKPFLYPVFTNGPRPKPA